MPWDAIPVPLQEDHREPLTIPEDAGQQLSNVRSWQQRLQKAGGLTRLGNANDLVSSAAVSNFFEGAFSDDSRRLLAMGQAGVAAFLQTWDGSSWSSNISGAGGRDTLPLTGSSRYSIVNTLDQVYIAPTVANPAIDSNIIVYDRTIAPPGDLVLLAHGANLGAPDLLSCRVILAFADRLVLVRTIENRVDKPTTIRWNSLDAGPAGGFDTSLAGAAVRTVMETSSEPLTGGFVIGERCFLTKAHEILELIPTGNVDSVFAVQSRVSGSGLIAPYSVAVVQNVAFFIGSDNVYMFDGNQLKTIGDPILDPLAALFAAQGNQLLRAQGTIYPRRGEYHLVPYPATSRYYYVFDYLRGHWYTRDMRAPGTEESGGPLAIGSVSGALYSGIDPDTQTVVMNGGDTAQRSVFVENEAVNSRIGYSTATDAFTCTVRTRQITPKRRGFRGVVEPAAIDKMNILFEVAFRGPASSDVTVTATEGDSSNTQSQTVRTDAGGRGKAYFNLAWQAVDFTFEHSGTGDFRLAGIVSYRWAEGGMHIPTDPV